MRTKTPFSKTNKIPKKYYLVDAQGQNLGRLATKIAVLLMGKNKPIYVSYLDCGDHVVVINAKDVQVSATKLDDKKYQWHSMYPGGFKEISLAKLLKTKPERVIELAVKRMLPQNRLGRAQFRKLRVYRDSKHKQVAQKPIPLT